MKKRIRGAFYDTPEDDKKRAALDEMSAASKNKKVIAYVNCEMCGFPTPTTQIYEGLCPSCCEGVFSEE